MYGVDQVLSQQTLCKGCRRVCYYESVAFGQIEKIDIGLNAVAGGKEQQLPACEERPNQCLLET